MTARTAENGQEVIDGIDAGGSSTRARALERSAPVFEGVGGPGNPLMAGPETIRASYQAALDGCPAAARVAVCVSGGGGEAQRAQIAALLADRFPYADVHVAPDYVAAFMAAPLGSDLCIVAGTGSVVCSRAADGSFPVSGGRGWILGDHGGAARLGGPHWNTTWLTSSAFPRRSPPRSGSCSATVTGVPWSGRSMQPATPRRCWLMPPRS